MSAETVQTPAKVEEEEEEWQPEPAVIAELYEKLDKDGVLELEWKRPARAPIQDSVASLSQEQPSPEAVENELKLLEKRRMLSMFEEDDINNKSNTPASLSKTPKDKAPRSNSKAKASFDKIFSKVSNRSSDATASNSEHL